VKEYDIDDVKKAIAFVFPMQSEQTILDIINPDRQNDYERVQLAIIKLSEGNIEKLHRMVQLAESDYRDVLMLAEYRQDGGEVPLPYKVIGIT
jgi:hypothetical protein